MNKLLEIKDLTVSTGGKKVIDGVSFDLYPGKVTALVGESGSGKTLTALSVLDLLPRAAVRLSGEILFKGRDISVYSKEEMRKFRGGSAGIVFQEPFSALNPVMRVGDQITETIRAHGKDDNVKAKRRLKNLMDMVKLSMDKAGSYPHELSGGMRQRIMLAMALSADPEVLMLDEPTTALDVSIQKEILDLIKRVQVLSKFAMLFITHDFSVVNMIADEVCVMKSGVLVEKGTKDDVLMRPSDPYTQRLIACIPRLGDKRERLPV